MADGSHKYVLSKGIVCVEWKDSGQTILQIKCLAQVKNQVFLAILRPFYSKFKHDYSWLEILLAL